MKKIIILGSLVSMILFGSCSTEEVQTSNPAEANVKSSHRAVPRLSYRDIRVDNVSVTEIGTNHNNYLALLRANTGTTQLTPIEIKTISLDKLPIVNTMFNSTLITDSIDDFFSRNLIGSSQTSQEQFPAQVFDLLVKRSEISIAAKDELINLTELNVTNIEAKTDELINDTATWTFKERQYFAVYTTVFLMSTNYWTANPPVNAKVSPAIVDAVGGVLGLFGGPVWAIIQGGIASYIVGG